MQNGWTKMLAEKNKEIAALKAEIAALEKTATEQDDCILHFQARVAALTAEIEEFKAEHFRTEGELHQTPCTWGILCPYCKIIELRVEVDRLRDALKKIARGSDDVDSSGEKSLPFDGDYAQTVAQAALKEAADA